MTDTQYRDLQRHAVICVRVKYIGECIKAGRCISPLPFVINTPFAFRDPINCNGLAEDRKQAGSDTDHPITLDDGIDIKISHYDAPKSLSHVIADDDRMDVDSTGHECSSTNVATEPSSPERRFSPQTSPSGSLATPASSFSSNEERIDSHDSYMEDSSIDSETTVTTPVSFSASPACAPRGTLLIHPTTTTPPTPTASSPRKQHYRRHSNSGETTDEELLRHLTQPSSATAIVRTMQRFNILRKHRHSLEHSKQPEGTYFFVPVPSRTPETENHRQERQSASATTAIDTSDTALPPKKRKLINRLKEVLVRVQESNEAIALAKTALSTALPSPPPQPQSPNIIIAAPQPHIQQEIVPVAGGELSADEIGAVGLVHLMQQLGPASHQPKQVVTTIPAQQKPIIAHFRVKRRKPTKTQKNTSLPKNIDSSHGRRHPPLGTFNRTLSKISPDQLAMQSCFQYK